MKINKLMTTAAMCVAVATLTVTSSQALTSIQVQEVKKAVLGVPVPEMPAKAAELVTKAEKKDRQAVAVTAVRAVVTKHRAAAPMVISAVSKAAPELASIVAVVATQIVTEQAPMIARAAAISAPGQAREITAAVSGVSGVTPQAASSVSAMVNQVSSRGSASGSGSSGGTITISPTPIDNQTGGAGNGTFNGLTPPQQVGDPVVVYGSPQP
jgi:hypothetical protein